MLSLVLGHFGDPSGIALAQVVTDKAAAPKPARMVIRVGSIQFWHADIIRCVALSPDGKLAASGGTQRLEKELVGKGPWITDRKVVVWNVPAGTVKHKFLLPENSHAYSLAFSPDGQSLVAAGDNMLFQWDLATGKEMPHIRLNEQPYRVRFTPDGQHLLINLYNKEFLKWDLEKRTDTVLWRNKRTDPKLMTWISDATPDGALLAYWVGTARDRAKPNDNLTVKTLTLEVFDVAAGRPVFQTEVQAPEVAMAVSPDKKTVAFGNDRLEIWDIAQKRKIRELPAVSWPALESSFLAMPRSALPAHQEFQGAATLLYSPNGKILAANYVFSTVLWNVESGQKIGEFFHHFKLSLGAFNGFAAFSRDSKRLAVAGTEYLRFFDTDTGMEVGTNRHHRAAVTEFRFSPDGAKLLTRSDLETASWETKPWKNTSNHSLAPFHKKNVRSVSLNMGWLITRTKDEYFLEEIASGKVLAQFPTKGRKFTEAGLSHDGKTAVLYLVDKDWDATAVFFSLPECREMHKLHIGKAVHAAFSAVSNCFSWVDPDGAYFDADPLTGKSVKQRTRPRDETEATKPVRSIYSRDNRYRVIKSATRTEDGVTYSYQCWDFKNGRPLTKGTDFLPPALADVEFTFDNRFLVFLEPGQPGIRVLELASGKLRSPLVGGHALGHRNVETSPIDWTFASGMPGGPVIIWDLALPRKKLTDPKFTKDELSSLWQDLAGDVLKAEDAIESLIQVPKQSVAFLFDRLKDPALDPKHFKRLIGELASEIFAVREKAATELYGKLGFAEPALRQALAQESTPLEARSRIEKMLSKLPRPLEPTALQVVRAVEVIEKVGSADAIEAVEMLSRGDPSTRLTEEALSAYQRMKRKANGRK